ncbi:hypothetical protein BOX15_Mlig026533g1 [Macrostomum lignano]|uniref:Uncharacterized protein n=1 Tax=Macrostomum lignano TaxID=282301 RepID=A0A267GMJ9_9PLAT|nr:hypothetical protein BOX15_Mlig026533g1 [Macrostomum lignano]
MSEEQSPFAKGAVGGSGGGGESGPIYGDQTAKQVVVERGLFIAAKVNLLITLILCIVRAAVNPVNAGLYLMYALSLCLFTGLEFYLIHLERMGELVSSRRWFVYVFGVFMFVQSICTDILVFE